MAGISYQNSWYGWKKDVSSPQTAGKRLLFSKIVVGIAPMVVVVVLLIRRVFASLLNFRIRY